MDTINVNLTIRYVTLILGGLVTVGTTLYAVYLGKSIEVLIPVFGGGVALTALLYTAINSNFTFKVHLEKLRIDKLEKAMNFIEHSSSTEMTKAVHVGMKLREEIRGKNAQEIKAIFENEPDKKEKILMVFNYFERLGLVVRYEAANEDVLKEYYQGVVKRYWHSFSPWILDLRTEYQDSNLMKEMEFLVNRWS